MADEIGGGVACSWSKKRCCGQSSGGCQRGARRRLVRSQGDPRYQKIITSLTRQASTVDALAKFLKLYGLLHPARPSDHSHITFEKLDLPPHLKDEVQATDVLRVGRLYDDLLAGGATAQAVLDGLVAGAYGDEEGRFIALAFSCTPLIFRRAHPPSFLPARGTRCGGPGDRDRSACRGERSERRDSPRHRRHCYRNHSGPWRGVLPSLRAGIRVFQAYSQLPAG